MRKLRAGKKMIVIAVLGIGTLLVLLFLLSVTFYQLPFVVRFAQWVAPNITFYVSTEAQDFSLTFDDGPNPPYTDQILEILDRYQAKATFFFVGIQVEKHPEYIEECLKRGHQIGNHMYKETPTVLMTEQDFIASVEEAERLIEQDVDRRLFRPGSGWIRPALLTILRDRGYKVVLGSAYVSDRRNPPAWYMSVALKSMLSPGAIVILHDGGDNREPVIRVLEELLDHASRKGLRSVTVSELMSKQSLD